MGAAWWRRKGRKEGRREGARFDVSFSLAVTGANKPVLIQSLVQGAANPGVDGKQIRGRSNFPRFIREEGGR